MKTARIETTVGEWGCGVSSFVYLSIIIFPTHIHICIDKSYEQSTSSHDEGVHARERERQRESEKERERERARERERTRERGEGRAQEEEERRE